MGIKQILWIATKLVLYFEIKLRLKTPALYNPSNFDVIIQYFRLTNII
jgi:hypothetical protein